MLMLCCGQLASQNRWAPISKTRKLRRQEQQPLLYIVKPACARLKGDPNPNSSDPDFPLCLRGSVRALHKSFMHLCPRLCALIHPHQCLAVQRKLKARRKATTPAPLHTEDCLCWYLRSTIWVSYSPRSSALFVHYCPPKMTIQTVWVLLSVECVALLSLRFL